MFRQSSCVFAWACVSDSYSVEKTHLAATLEAGGRRCEADMETHMVQLTFTDLPLLSGTHSQLLTIDCMPRWKNRQKPRANEDAQSTSRENKKLSQSSQRVCKSLCGLLLRKWWNQTGWRPWCSAYLSGIVDCHESVVLESRPICWGFLYICMTAGFSEPWGCLLHLIDR